MNVRRITNRIVLGLGLSVALGAATDTAVAQDAALAVGAKAPAFEARDDRGKVWRSRDHVGKKLLVVYFYPAAFTGGCTKQACSFRDNRSQLSKLGANVVGVSGDKVESLREFKGQNRLNFPLLSDAEGNIAKAFGVPLRQGGSNKTTVKGKDLTVSRDVTTARWTFIIDRNGNIVYRDTQVNPEGDSQRVIDALKRLASR